MYSNPTLIETKKFSDTRGFLIPQSFNHSWVQQNISQSTQGTFRGMHFQIGSSAQAKLVQVLQGSVVDFVVPLSSSDNPTVEHFHLSAENPTIQTTLYVPKGYAHGFIALEEHTIFHYLVDTPYDPEAERSLHYQSFPQISKTIQQYGFNMDTLHISKKDEKAPLFSDWKTRQEPIL